MKKITLLIAVMLAYIGSYGQTAIQYGFSAGTGTYTELASPTVLGTATTSGGATSLDDLEYRVNFPAGFTFSYVGNAQTAINIDSNGYVGFGTVAWTGYTYSPLSTNPSGGTTAGIITAFGADLNAYSTASTAPGSISWAVEGTGTDQVFVIQYKNFKPYENSDQVDRLLNFQIRLYASTHTAKPNYIEMVYGNTAIGDATNTGVNVGIRGAATGWAANVNSVMNDNIPAGTTCNWLNAVTANNNSNGNNFTNAATAINIPNGLVYTYYPQNASGPNPVRTFAATTFTTTTATLSWTAPTNATQYNVQYRTPASCSWTNWTGNPVTGTTVTLTGLAETTSYQVRVQASNGAVNSIWSQIPNTAGGGNGYTATGTFTTLASCVEPTALVIGASTTTTATYNFTASVSTPASGYDYYYSTANTAPTATTTPSGNVTGTTINLTGLTSNTTYYLWVRSKCSDTSTSIWTSTSFTTPCDPTGIPYTQDFESVTTPSIPACTSIQNAGLGNNWITTNNPGYGFTSKTLQYNYNSSNPGNAWFFTQGLNLTAGTSYRVTYKYGNNSTTYHEKLAVAYGTANNAAAMTVIQDLTSITGSAASTTYIDFVPATTGVYYVGFNAHSITDQFYLFVDDITVTVSPPPPAITSFTPASYCAASGIITITGTTLTAATLSIGGTAVPITSNTDTQIVATVPQGVSGTVTVTTSTGSFTSTGTFAVNAPPAVTVTPATAICAGQSATLTATSANTGYTYNWVPGNLTGATQTVTPTTTTTYTVTATDPSGCQVAQTVTVTVNAVPAAITVAASGSTVCSGTVLPLTATGGAIPGTATIGTATTLTGTTEQPTAFNNRWAGYTMQTIYTAAELSASGLVAGNLTSLAYNVTTLGDGATNANFSVKIGSVSGSSFADSNFLSATAFTTVYGPQTYTHTATGWQTINFSTPYAWDGVSNIVISITYNGADNLYNSQTYFTATTGNTVLWANNITATTGTPSPKRLNIMIGGSLSAPFTWTPAANLYTDAAGTVPYTGTAAATVYFKSSTAGAANYTVTATTPAACSTTGTATVNVNVTPAPTGAATQAICWSGTVADIVATGENIQIFNTATGGTPLAVTTPITAGTYYVSQTLNNCASPVRLAVAVTIINIAPPTVAADVVTFCNAGTVADLVATGTGIQWYAASTGGTPLAGTTAFTEGTTLYYASQTINGCESQVRTALAVVLNITEAPVADGTQTFCNTATVADLTTSGTAVQWYTAPTGGTALVSTTALTTDTIYYASQTVNNCESGVRTAVTAVINVTDAPAALASQTFCNTATVSDLVADSTSVNWYAAETGGEPLAATTALTTGTTYYASQIVNSCESATRTAVSVTISTAVASTLPDVSSCNSYVLPSVENGNYFDGANGTGTSYQAGDVITETKTIYIYAASDVTPNCTAESSFTVTISTVDAPTGVSPQVVIAGANGATIENIVVSAQGTVTWYATEADALAGTNPLAAGTTVTEGTTYYATQTVGTCTSTEALAITIGDILKTGEFDDRGFSYYPNPVINVLNISYTTDITSVRIFNMLGQQVGASQPNAANTTVDMSILAEGTYFVNVTAGTATKTIKVVKKQ